MADSKGDELSVKEIWAAAGAEFFRLTGKSLENGPIKSFDDVQVEIESRNNPPSGDTPAADDMWDKEKFKSAGLKVLKCLKMLVGAATQLSSIVGCPRFFCKHAIAFADRKESCLSRRDRWPPCAQTP